MLATENKLYAIGYADGRDGRRSAWAVVNVLHDDGAMQFDGQIGAPIGARAYQRGFNDGVEAASDSAGGTFERHVR